MPLRDHFKGVVSEYTRWEAIHAIWPVVIVKSLLKRLPPGYFAEPRNRHDGYEIDVGTLYDPTPEIDDSFKRPRNGGGTATKVKWKPTRPTFKHDVDFSRFDKYEVLVYKDDKEYPADRFHRKLVAAIEFVSPANKDRPESRRQFAAKCAALLGNGVSVTIVDVVTDMHWNLYRELMDFSGHPIDGEAATIYAATCRSVPALRLGNRLETWEEPLKLGKKLPIMPLWIDYKLVFPLDLERSYEETCKVYDLQQFD